MSVFFRHILVIFLSVFLSAPLVYCARPSGCPGLEEAKLKYLGANQYNEFVSFLDDFKDKNKINQLCLDYNKANARYLQLRYLEEKQSWDEYFANGNTYREQLMKNAQKVIEQADAADPLGLASRLLLWQFHYGQQDAFAQEALENLTGQAYVYAKEGHDPELIKDIADKLLAAGEKAKARLLYKLYVDQLTAGKVARAEFKNMADGFYREGNSELAQAVYNIYIENSLKAIASNSPKKKDAALKKFTQELFEIAGLFVYKPQGGGLASAGQSCQPVDFYKMAYAEEIYSKIEELGWKDAFNQDTIYLRAFNLEKFGDYSGAIKFYLKLIQLYPDTGHFDEAVYKIAMIEAYALADIEGAKKYFEMLAGKTVFSPQVVSSFYQLGLLAQWEEDPVKAKKYYDLLLKNSGDNYAGIVSAAKARLEEVEGSKQLDHNLKVFLDLSLKNAKPLAEAGKAELKSSGYALEKKQQAIVSSLVDMPQSGCNQVELQYLWSGDLEKVKPLVTEGKFQCAYSDAGTKAVNVVIISPAGAIDRSFIMIDVY